MRVGLREGEAGARGKGQGGAGAGGKGQRLRKGQAEAGIDSFHTPPYPRTSLQKRRDRQGFSTGTMRTGKGYLDKLSAVAWLQSVSSAGHTPLLSQLHPGLNPCPGLRSLPIPTPAGPWLGLRSQEQLVQIKQACLPSLCCVCAASRVSYQSPTAT